jgi:hypothetical protein
MRFRRGLMACSLIMTLLAACADPPLLPSHRIVGYYGNFYSPHMGILGEYPPDTVLQKLKDEVQHWEKADPKTPVIPAIEYIAVVAQNNPGESGKYILRMPHAQIQKAIDLAAQVNGIVILDVQPGHSDLQTELPHLAQYLALPQVMLALDPEYDMHSERAPGEVIGSMDAEEINYAANFLAEIVKKNNLPPKILIVHRFTEHMITNHREIKPLPEVQIVINMDGWGGHAKKRSTYEHYIAAEPVQFTGFKVFYHQDLQEEDGSLYTPEQILRFKPQPMFILYQ